MYETISALVSRIGPVHARKLAAACIHAAGVLRAAPDRPESRRHVMGLTFPSPIGLAAGFDKSGSIYSALPGLGFGFAEIGSVTPCPEQGRSPGLDAVIRRLSRYRHPHPIPLGLSISMNRATPIAKIPLDYVQCLRESWGYADYITLNLGVRSGPDLHLPEHCRVLRAVLSEVRQESRGLSGMGGRKIPIVVKIDQGRGDPERLADIACDQGVDGLILSGSGGAHVLQQSMLERLARALTIPIISVGGIRSARDAQDRIDAGATLIQVYTGLVQKGPMFVKSLNEQMRLLQSQADR